MKSLSYSEVNIVDTAKDARILILEDALHRLNSLISSRRFKFHVDYNSLTTAIQKASGLLYEIKFSYLDPAALAELKATNDLITEIGTVGTAYRQAMKSAGYSPHTTKESLTIAEMEYALRIVEGFQRRLLNSPDDPAFATDILAVEISQVESIAGSKNLSKCRCTDGSRRWQILTNLEGIKQGMRLPCIVLPPVEMMDSVSEAMFLGLEELGPDRQLGLLTDVPPSSLKQARAQVLQVIKRLM